MRPKMMCIQPIIR